MAETKLSSQALARASLQSGWIDPQETWAYASATTITVPTGAAARYKKGDKIQIKQTTVKYFYIIGVADTTLTVTGGSDYSVANAAITDNYFSHQSTPTGFPVYFNWTPTLTGGNADFAGYDVARFTIEGTLLRLCFTISNRNLSGTAGTIQITVPVTVGSGGSGAWGVYKMYTAATGYVNARCILGDSGTYMELQKDMTSGTWAGNETGVYIIIDGFYWI